MPGRTDKTPPTGRPAIAPLVELRDAVVRIGGTEILHGVDLVLTSDENVAILGPNGAGKSTLVGLVVGERRALVHDDGSAAVRVLGQERWDLFEIRRELGVVSDSLQTDYDRHVSALDAVVSGFFGSIGLYRHHAVTADMRDRACAALERMGIAGLALRTMDTLSTGEARRALIARALVHEPAALLLDEPFHGLDPRARYELRESLRELAAGGTGLVLVTHEIGEIVPEISRVIAVRDGRIAADGAKEELLTGPVMSDLFGFPAKVTETNGYYHLW
jgi:iron complex transport system ATP-binding protein